MYKWLTPVVVCLLSFMQQVYADSVILDGFEELEGWTVATPDGVALEIAQDEGHSGSGMRLDFDFHGGGGYVVARKKLSVPLPANYAFSFYVRGEAPDNDLQFKLLDPSEKEIWWAKRRDFSFPAEWQKITVKKRHLKFAWGPSGGEALKEVAVVEFGIAAGNGGKGSVWVDDLMFEERPVSEYNATPLVRASTTAYGHEPANVFDGDTSTSWKSGSIAEEQWLLIDFQRNSEYGGLIIDWQQDDYAKAYEVQISDDGENWRRVFSVKDNNGGRDYVYLPDFESRFLRLDLQSSSRGRGYGIVAIEVKPYQFSISPNNLFAAVAADSPRGDYPRYLTGEQSYWTVVGVSGDEKEALLNQDGLLEVDKEHFSIEPFLYMDDSLVGWNDVTLTQELEGQYLPIPSVMWERSGLKLRITALAAGKAGSSSLYARYRVENHTKQRQQGKLFLALRPFQVNPPWQSLNMNGGAASIREMFYNDNTVLVDNEKALTSLSTVKRFGAVTFAQGSILGYLHKGHLPPMQTHVFDSFGYASAALEYGFDLPPEGAQSFYITVPFYQSGPLVEANFSQEQAQQTWHTAFEVTRRYWESKLNHVDIQLPHSADKLVRTLKSTVAYILINQDGPAIQPGSRAYDRSWIRDGALTAAALLRMGHTQEVKDFIEWYGKYQWASGKIPCCVDWRGRDPVEEHDSQGEWIYLVMDYYRFTRDVGFLTTMWPRIVSAMKYIVWLRNQRLTDEYKTPEKLLFYGLVPESVSHEGYMDSPMHSYWDDLFVLRGLKDAAYGADILGEEGTAQRFSSLRDAFRNDLMTSIRRSMTLHRVNYIPGAAELGDFDSNATTIGLDPVGETSALPQEALRRTFDKYYEILTERVNEDKDWRVYTPYELRAVGAFIRMGQKERAHEALDFFFQGQRPQAWNQWAEVVWRDPKTPKYIGDMPHTWVGSDYIRSIRSLFVYERESDQALVIGAGVIADWVTSDQGISIKRLPTYYGTLNYSMRMLKDGLAVELSGDVNLPPGKIVLRSPLNTPLSEVTVNGKPIKSYMKDEVIVDQFPAKIMLHYENRPRTVQMSLETHSTEH